MYKPANIVKLRLPSNPIMLTMMLALRAEKHNTLNMCFISQPCSMLNMIGPEASIKASVIIDKTK